MGFRLPFGLAVLGVSGCLCHIGSLKSVQRLQMMERRRLADIACKLVHPI